MYTPLAGKSVLFLLCTFITSGLCSATRAVAQTPAHWKVHDMRRPRPVLVTPGKQSLPISPPSDAIVLFDGKDLSQWRSAESEPPRWIIRDGYMESVPDSGYLYTVQSFGDAQLHVEWAAPTPVKGDGQGRGNSGVFLMGAYEVQVLDSYKNDTYPDGQAASIYGQHPPLVNVALPPGQWQSYDIVFRRPRFNIDGKVVKPARMTVFHNGVLVQDCAELQGPTRWLQHLPYVPHIDKLPLSLQDHGNPVRYRNIWIRELRETIEPGPTTTDDRPVVALPLATLEKYAGRYEVSTGEVYLLKVDDRGILTADFFTAVDLVPHSEKEFSLRWTDGTIFFDLDPQGTPVGLTFDLGGKQRVAKKL